MQANFPQIGEFFFFAKKYKKDVILSEAKELLEKR
jgi:hypothetical protein